MDREIVAILSIDDMKAESCDLGTVDYIERKIEVLESDGVSLENCFIADTNDESLWQRYLNYLSYWVFDHLNEECVGMSPARFDEWKRSEIKKCF